jgi:hypothetical protein
MYAYTDNGFRAIQQGWPLLEAEQLSATIPEATLLNIRKEEATREIRGRIAATNWAMVEDADITAMEKTAIRAYRASLRALPNHPDFPDMPWPGLPSTSGVGNETGETL